MVPRYVDDNNWIEIRYDVSGVAFVMYKNVAGVQTNVGFRTISPANGDVIKVTFSGDTYAVYLNGAQQGATFTISDLQTATKHGMAANGTIARIDDFSFTGASVPDTTPPTLTSPTGTKTGSSTADLSVTTDEANGTLYAVVTTSNTAPSAAQVKAGHDHTGTAAAFADSQAIGTTGAKTFNADSLAASTTYYAHFMHEDAATNQSTVANSASFTTDAPPPDTTPPVLASATTSADGLTTLVTLTEADNPPVLPATGITGFSLSASGGFSNGASLSVASAARTSPTVITLTHGRRVYLDETITVTYASGNVTDSAASPNAMAGFGPSSVTNASTWKGAYVVAGRTLQPGVNYGNQTGYTTFTNLEFVGEGVTSIVDLQTKQVYHDNLTGNNSVRLVNCKALNWGIPTTFVKTPGAGSITSDAALMHGLFVTHAATSSGEFRMDRVTWDASNTFRHNVAPGSTATDYVDSCHFLDTTTNAAESTPETSNEIGYFWLSGGGAAQFTNNTWQKGWIRFDAQGSRAWTISGNACYGIRTFLWGSQCTGLTVNDNFLAVRQGSIFDAGDPGGVYGSQNQGCAFTDCDGSEGYDNVFDGGQWVERGLSGNWHDNLIVHPSSHAIVITPQDDLKFHHNIVLYDTATLDNKGWIVFTVPTTGVDFYNNTYIGYAGAPVSGAVVACSATSGCGTHWNNIFYRTNINRGSAGDAVFGPDEDSESISGTPPRPAANADRLDGADRNAFFDLGSGVAPYGVGVAGETEGTGAFAANDITDDPNFADPTYDYTAEVVYADVIAGTDSASAILDTARAAWTPRNTGAYLTSGTTTFGGSTPTYIGAQQPAAGATTPIEIGTSNIPVDGSVAYADFATHGGGNITLSDASKFSLKRGGVVDGTVVVTKTGNLELTFTPGTVFAGPEVVTISGLVGGITDANGDPLQAFTDFPVTNAADTTAPTVLAAGINATSLTVTFNEAIDDGASTFAGFSVTGTSATIGTPVFSGDRVLTFPVSGTLLKSDMVKLAYNATTGTVLDPAGNEMIGFSNFSVTNGLGGVRRPPVLLRRPLRFAVLRGIRAT